MKKKLIFGFFFFWLSQTGFSQPGISDLQSAKMQAWGYQCKLSAIVTINGGTNLSASIGIWKNNYDVQPSLNTSFNWMLGFRNFGCRKAEYQRSKGTIIFSPLLLVKCGQGASRVAEVNPFYFGYNSALLSNYKHYFAIGTSLVTAPKGLDKNIMTARNRSQQLIYLGGKYGWDNGYFMVNLYEDFFALTNNYLQGLADNRDRFFTGGGNIQVNLNHYWTFKYYTEAYTGSSYIDHIQYPDLVYPYKFIGNEKGWKKFFSGPKRYLRYAYQDAGQNAFNQGRDFLVAEYSGPIGSNFEQQDISINHHTGKISAVVGIQGNADNMWQQNLIHNAINQDKFTGLGTGSEVDRYHRFEPRSTTLSVDADGMGNKANYKSKFVFGLGYSYGIQ